MRKTRKTQNPYQSKIHKIYGSPEVVAGLDALCKLEKKSRSEVVIQLVSAHLRKKAAKMRAARLSVPAEIFVK